jgi:hypothetical protein
MAEAMTMDMIAVDLVARVAETVVLAGMMRKHRLRVGVWRLPRWWDVGLMSGRPPHVALVRVLKGKPSCVVSGSP